VTNDDENDDNSDDDDDDDEQQSASVTHFMRASITAGTQASYDTAVRRYRVYQMTRGWDDSITALRGAEWLAHLAESTSLSSNTIQAYRSALSTHYAVHSSLTADGVNPMQHTGVGRLMQGIKHTKRADEAASRAARPVSDPVTIEMIEKLTTVVGTTDLDVMMLAAASLAMCAGLRPGELLGSAKVNHYGRALRMNQLVFYYDNTDIRPISAAVCASAEYVSITPNHCVLTLKQTKTTTQPIYIQLAASIVVMSLWRWCHIRHRDRRDGDHIFRVAGSTPLRTSSLLGHTQRELRQHGYPTIVIKGKCFRRGLASTLAARGTPSSDIAAAGHWAPTSRVWERYTSEQAKVQRERDVNRRL
jgi:hypothetical protein